LIDTEKGIEDIFQKYQFYSIRDEALMPILQDIQDKFHYIPEECLREVSQRLEIPLNRVYAIATFYNAFSLEPKGKYIIQVCMGTACHVRGAPEIVEEAERILKIKRGHTTRDMKFSLETVNCLGACALGPIMVINGEYHGHLSPDKVKGILKQYD
jgi:NADH-quinone oxidoreductase subunit E